MTERELDIEANRRAVKYTRGELLVRAAWIPGQWLFRWSPRTAFGFRAALLRLFGARVGRNVHIYATARIYIPFNLEIGDDSSIGEWALVYALGPVSIGRRCTISHQAHLCAGTHDARDVALPLVRSSIRIEDEAWVCADAFVGPDVTVGARAIVGARAVAVRDVAPDSIVGGNPAQVIGTRELRA